MVDERGGIGELIVVEGEYDAFGPRIEADDARLFAQQFDLQGGHEMLDLDRAGAEAINQFGGEAFEFGGIRKVRGAAIEAEAQRQILDIGLGDEDGHAKIDLRRPALGDFFVAFYSIALFHVGDRFFEHGLVQLDADLFHMAGLLLAEQITEAANVHVMAGELEACTQCVELLHHLKAALRLARELLAVG